MTPKPSRPMLEEEDTRGGEGRGGCCVGCFGWLCKLLRWKKGGRRPENKNKDAEPSLTSVDGVKEREEVEEVGEERQKDRELVDEQEQLVVTWAEEVDEAEEKGVNVFAPEMSVLPHTVFVTSASPENKATGAALTQRRMTACQRRRARRRARDAALKETLESHASAENEAVKTMNSEAVNTMNNDRPTDNSSSEAVHSGTTATRRCRGRRRKAAAATNNSHV